MTAYIAFDYIKNNKIHKNDIVKISKNSVKTARITNSARTFLEERHRVDVDTVLKGLIVQSGNDAAIAIAEHISNNEAEFVKLMNQYAKNMGMVNTNFNNASGLPTDNHYSTAYDLSILSRNIIKDFPELYAYYFSLKSFTYNDIYQPNRNKLLFREDIFDGIKTGWTQESGYCFSTTAIDKGRRLIIVTLNADKPEQRFEDAKILAEYGIKNFTNIILTQANHPIQGAEKIPIYYSNETTAEIVPEKTVIKTIRKDDLKNIRAELIIPKKLKAPIDKNDIIGEIIFFKNNKPFESIKIITKNEYKIGNWKNYLIDHLSI